MRTVGVTRWLAALALAACVSGAGLVAGGSGPTGAQGDETIFRLVMTDDQISEGDLQIPVEVTVENATNMASFQFDFKFDPNVFELGAPDPAKPQEFAQKGDFLGSTGRDVVCDQVSDAGIARMNCVSLRPSPAGPDGAGKLATVYLNATGSGDTTLELDRVKANIVSEQIPVPELNVRAESLALDVAGGGGGINWAIWGPVIGVIALVLAGGAVFALLRMRGSDSGKPATAV